MSIDVLPTGSRPGESKTCTVDWVTAMSRMTVEHCGTAVLLRADGEIDAANVSMWKSQLNEAAAAAPTPGALLVDTSGLEFMALCAFAALIDQSAECRRRGIRLCLVGARPFVKRVMAAARFDAELPCYDSVAAAFEALPAHSNHEILPPSDTGLAGNGACSAVRVIRPSPAPAAHLIGYTELYFGYEDRHICP